MEECSATAIKSTNCRRFEREVQRAQANREELLERLYTYHLSIPGGPLLKCVLPAAAGYSFSCVVFPRIARKNHTGKGARLPSLPRSCRRQKKATVFVVSIMRQTQFALFG